MNWTLGRIALARPDIARVVGARAFYQEHRNEGLSVALRATVLTEADQQEHEKDQSLHGGKADF